MLRRDDRLPAGLLALVLVALVAAGIAPYDRRVFALEVGPWVVLLAGVVAIHRRYPMTPVSQVAIAGLCLLFVLGAHYTYTRVPAPCSRRSGSRNPYDRIVHFAGGFVADGRRGVPPDRLVRGGRRSSWQWSAWRAALYDPRWWIAIAAGQGAGVPLAGGPVGRNGYIALLGAALAQGLLSRPGSPDAQPQAPPRA
jgi:uncharacterized membrane protein YjdF